MVTSPLLTLDNMASLLFMGGERESERKQEREHRYGFICELEMGLLNLLEYKITVIVIGMHMMWKTILHNLHIMWGVHTSVAIQ